MNPYAAVVRAAGRTRWFAWIGSRVLHRADLRFRGHRRTLTTFGTTFPLCYLTTTGRRSGEPRTVPLLWFESDGGGIVLVGSNWGRRRHPSWALNLEASPDARVAIDDVDRPMRARRATAVEVDRYWPRIVEVWPGYDGYRRRAGREIRVFVLDPEGETAS